MSPYESQKLSFFVLIYMTPVTILLMGYQTGNLRACIATSDSSTPVLLIPFSLSVEKSIQVLSLHIFFCPLNLPCLLLRSYHSMLLPFPGPIHTTLLFLAPRNSFFSNEPISPMFYSSLFPFTQNTNVQSPNNCKMEEKNID